MATLIQGRSVHDSGAVRALCAGTRPCAGTDGPNGGEEGACGEDRRRLSEQGGGGYVRNRCKASELLMVLAKSTCTRGHAH